MSEFINPERPGLRIERQGMNELTFWEYGGTEGDSGTVWDSNTVWDSTTKYQNNNLVLMGSYVRLKGL